MIEKIEELESKGFRITISPQNISGQWLWIAGVYVGNERKAEWVDSDNGLPKAGYSTYREAFNSVLEYCENYSTKKRSKKAKV